MVLKMEMSKTYQYRKVMKPMLERKRRARINKCLDDLKDLMVECLKREGEHVTRLEKADILELTVEHMRKLKQRGTLTIRHPTNVDCFRSGFVHAADQVSKALAATPGIDVDLGTKLMTYLGNRLNQICHHPISCLQVPLPLVSRDSEYNRLSSKGYKENSPECCNRGGSKEFQPIVLDRKEKMDFCKSDLWRPW